MKARVLYLLIPMMLTISIGFTATAQPDDPVPSEYQALYDTLDTHLTSAEEFIAAQPVSADSEPVFGAELLPANGNRGEALLEPNTLMGTIQYLDALQALGIGGVTLEIKLPLLLSDFPRSAEYLEFFRQVVSEVRARGLHLLIENGPAFSGTIYSPIVYDYSGMTVEEYLARRIEMLLTIARELQPDYMAIGTEVSTEVMLSGFQFTADEYAAFVSDAAAQIHEVNPNVLVGSGIGVWEHPNYVATLLADPNLDYIGLHFYPLATGNRDLVRATFDLADQIESTGKQVIMGEAWLYKVDPAQLAGLGNNFTEIYARDVYSFWQPLDQRFIAVIAQMARVQGWEYVSFYWSMLFFGCIDYDATSAELSPSARYDAVNRVAYQNLLAGSLTPLGVSYRDVITNDIP